MVTTTLPDSRPARHAVIPLGPPHPYGFLLDHRPADHFAAECVHADLPASEKLRLAGLYADRWGTAGLVRALRKAAHLAPLDGTMAGLLRDLTRVEVLR